MAKREEQASKKKDPPRGTETSEKIHKALLSTAALKHAHKHGEPISLDRPSLKHMHTNKLQMWQQSLPRLASKKKN